MYTSFISIRPVMFFPKNQFIHHCCSSTFNSFSILWSISQKWYKILERYDGRSMPTWKKLPNPMETYLYQCQFYPKRFVPRLYVCANHCWTTWGTSDILFGNKGSLTFLKLSLSSYLGVSLNLNSIFLLVFLMIYS